MPLERNSLGKEKVPGGGQGPSAKNAPYVKARTSKRRAAIPLVITSRI
jgi:hypothetical protein